MLFETAGNLKIEEQLFELEESICNPHVAYVTGLLSFSLIKHLKF